MSGLGAVTLFTSNVNEHICNNRFTIDFPNHVFYLQDDNHLCLHAVDASIPPEAEYRNMMQVDKQDADDLDFETFDLYI
jgi:hypothetical protein